MPSSTYRVQLSSAFTLHDLAAHVPHVARLGVSHLYLSPIYRSRPGSPHGYDIVDHGCVNDELGGFAGWRTLSAAARAHGMGIVIDIVPNHMAADPVHNRLWRQVLRDGPSSSAARFFDIDWRPLTGLVHDKVLLPILEEPYGEALIRGAAQLEHVGGELRIRCGTLHLPLSAPSIERLAATGSLDEIIARINGSPDLLHQLLEQQHYRLAYWKPANDEINYRRFFGINELIAIRPEDDEVFAQSHRLMLRLAADAAIDGVRVDHVDGLLEPVVYLQRLRSSLEAAAPHGRPWIVVEKVLDPSETLGADWPVDGTTGYDALDVLNRLFVSGRGVRILRRFFQQLVDDHTTFREEAYRSKRLIMHGALRSGVTMLAHELKRVADAAWATRDISLNALEEALVEFIASLPVYRTYLGGPYARLSDRDVVTQSLETAARRNPSMDSSAFTFLRGLLVGEPADDGWLARRRARLVKRLQQYTSGVHAKGVEDTAFFRDNTLLALNEVGGNPAIPSLATREFHRFNEHRVTYWPGAMTATSTHDTKLGEDARVRIAALSTCAREWTKAVRRWRGLTSPLRRDTRGGQSPDVRDEYRLYQALVGVWSERDIDADGRATPELVERIVGFMRKSAREAQINTSWMRPDDDYESGLEAFVRRALAGDEGAAFRQSMHDFIEQFLPVTVYHSIAQLVLKCLMPGVPDFYQGCEDWALTLTDPDNRRPVDMARLAARLAEAEQMPRAPLAVDASGLKLFVTATLLRFRREHEALLRSGTYRALRVRGSRSGSVVAFERRSRQSRVVVAVPRVSDQTREACGDVSGTSFWGDTELRLPSSRAAWTHLLTGETASISRPWCSLAELTTACPWVVMYT